MGIAITDGGEEYREGPSFLPSFQGVLTITEVNLILERESYRKLWVESESDEHRGMLRALIAGPTKATLDQGGSFTISSRHDKEEDKQNFDQAFFVPTL